MERIASYPPSIDNRVDLDSRLAASAVSAPSSVTRRFVGSGHSGVVVLRIDEIAEESRDDPQMASHRWNGESSWKPPVVGRSMPYERSLRDVAGGSHHHTEGQIYAGSSIRHHPHSHWHQHSTDHRWYRGRGSTSANHGSYASMEHPNIGVGGMVPISSHDEDGRRNRQHRYRTSTGASTYTAVASSSQQAQGYQGSNFTHRDSAGLPSSHRPGMNFSVVVIPKNITIPKEMAPSPPDQRFKNADASVSPTEQSLLGKRSSDSSESSPRQAKRTKIVSGIDTARLEGKFDKLDLLCSATLELGPLQDNPTGCSCPKSKCIALYCDCFKAGRRCNPSTCTCLNCKNTLAESGPDGARSKV